jgi:hypothetical protein
MSWIGSTTNGVAGWRTAQASLVIELAMVPPVLPYFIAIASALVGPCPDSLTGLAGPRAAPIGVARCAAADTTRPKKRVKALELSGAYETRAAIPLFAGQAIVGQQLFAVERAGNRPSQGMRATHDVLAASLGALFAVNTVTGSLNWWETRSQPAGRTWVTIHSALMLVSDAGFAYTAALGSNARRLQADRILHKSWAIGSGSIALASYLMMLWPIRRD